MSSWSIEQVLALAPDASSASAGQGLAAIKKWSGIGQSDRAIWGLCQGSGSLRQRQPCSRQRVSPSQAFPFGGLTTRPMRTDSLWNGVRRAHRTRCMAR